MLGRFFGDGEIDFKSREIAIVNADNLRSGLERAMQFFFAVDFDECIELKTCGRAQKANKVGLLQRRDDQQDRICTVNHRLGNLDFIENEILAQQRQ